jgi:hypothetical protein
MVRLAHPRHRRRRRRQRLGQRRLLTVAEVTLRGLSAAHGKEFDIHLFGQEINAETFAISKAELLLKGGGAEADNIRQGSTLSEDACITRRFDFILSNPPYGKSWKKDFDALGGKDAVTDRRFVVHHQDEPDPHLRDTEQIPFETEGGIDGFIAREVLPCAPDAWVDPAQSRTGYGISFTREFYKPQPLRTLGKICANIEARERETEGLLERIVVSQPGGTV